MRKTQGFATCLVGASGSGKTSITKELLCRDGKPVKSYSVGAR